MNSIAYCIHDRSQSKMLELFLAPQEKPGIASLQKKITGDATRLLYLCPQSEKATIETLISEEMSFREKEGKNIRVERQNTLASFRIRPAKAFALIKLLAAQKQLFFKGKLVLVDPFTRLDIAYTAQDTQDNLIEVEAKLTGPAKNIPIQDLDFLAHTNPVTVIHANYLTFAQDNLSYSDLSPFFEKKKLTLSKEAFSLWVKEKEEEDEPFVIDYQRNTINSIEAKDPLPIVKLQDRVGTCASLLMDYGSTILPYHRQETRSFIPKGSTQSTRNIKAEDMWEKDFLESGYIRKPSDNASYYCPVDKIAQGLQLLLDIGWKVHDYEGKEVTPLTHLNVSLELEQEKLIIKGKAEFLHDEQSIEPVIDALRSSNHFVMLKGNRIGLLANDTALNPLRKLLPEVEILQGKPCLKKNRIGELTDSTPLTIASEYKEGILLSHFIRGKHPEVTPGDRFKGTLRKYQQEGLNWLHALYINNFSGLLADDMGLGKTVQVIALLSTLPRDITIVIVVPASLLYQWQREISQFLHDTTSIVYHGQERDENQISSFQKHIVITSYGIIRKEIDLFKKLSIECLILDEAQAIKNKDSQLFKALSTLQAHFRLSITGTPLENSLSELWTQFSFLDPLLFNEKESFSEELKNNSLKAFGKIKQRIKPFLLRRTKEEVAQDLPAKIEHTIYVEMSEAQEACYRQFYEQLRSGLIQKVKQDGYEKHKMEVLEAILRLKQISCHPRLLANLAREFQDFPLESAKFDLVIDDIETIIQEGKKVCLFSQFASMIDILENEMQSRGIRTLVIQGSTDIKTRMENVDKFQNEQDYPLFLISLKAGGTGLTLTKADYVILFDPWWNRSQERQAIDRAHRIGRTDTVICKRYIVKNTIEEKIVALQEAKDSLTDAFLKEDTEASFLSQQDLSLLLNLNL